MATCQKCKEENIDVVYVYGTTTEEALEKGQVGCKKCIKDRNKDKEDKVGAEKK